MNQKTELSTSDRLAFGRTHLSNERTLLAYVRTFIGMVSAASLPMLVTGILRYLKTARGLKQYRSGIVNRTKG